jgi:hypothetical protein
MSSHSFDIHVATEYKSVEVAILVNHFQYWIMRNKALGKNQIEGRTWTYQTMREIAVVFPYWSIKQVERLLKKMIDNKILIKGRFNKNPFNTTLWYAFTDEDKFGISRIKTGQDSSSEAGDDIGNSGPTISGIIRPTKSGVLNKDRYIRKDIEEDICQAQAPPSELPFGQISRSFFDRLKENNPKIKKPDLKKWTREFELLSRRDGNSIEDIQKVIDYVFSTRDIPSDNGFCWANVILSPQNLRKHFARIWAEMKKPRSKSQVNDALEHKKYAERIEKKFKERMDINVCNTYIEFVNGPTSKVYEYGSKNFVENCTIQLQNRKLKL